MTNKKQLGKNLFVYFSIISSLYLIPSLAHAELGIREIKKEKIRREVVQDTKVEVREETKNLLERAKDMVKEKMKRQIKGTLVSITGTVLMVQKDQTTFTVNTTDKTEFKRKFGAVSSLSEFSPNDQLLIIGNRIKNTDGTLSSNEIEASYIRNMSIQRRFAVFIGEVTAKTESTLTLKTGGRGVQTVYVSTNTKYSEKNKTISFADILVGDKILVKGELWDRVNERIDAKSVLKLNFKKPSITPSITKSPEKE